MTNSLFGKIATPNDIKPRVAQLRELLDAQCSSVHLLFQDLEKQRKQDLAKHLKTKGAHKRDAQSDAINRFYDAKLKSLARDALQNMRPLREMIQFFKLDADQQITRH